MTAKTVRQADDQELFRKSSFRELRPPILNRLPDSTPVERPIAIPLDLASQRLNSFGLVRLILALLVVFGHCYPLGGFGPDVMLRWTGRLAVHEIALAGFFILSGYLLTGSLLAQPSLSRFTIRRLFRIVPGYWTVLLLTSLVIAPSLFFSMYPDGPRADQLSVFGRNVYGYLSKNLFFFDQQNNIMPLFLGNPHPRQVYGSLWTLFYELLCYAGLGLAAAAGALRCRTILLAGGALIYLPFACLSIFPFAKPLDGSLPGLILMFGLHPGGPAGVYLAFISGVIANLYLRDEACWHARWFWIVLVLWVVAVPLGAVRAIWPLTFPYLLLWLGRRSTFKNFERIGDFSYGVYIYAFLIQQSLAQFGWHQHGFWVFVALSIGLSLIAGVGSWIFIERPSIQLGQRVIKRWTRS